MVRGPCSFIHSCCVYEKAILTRALKLTLALSREPVAPVRTCPVYFVCARSFLDCFVVIVIACAYWPFSLFGLLFSFVYFVRNFTFIHLCVLCAMWCAAYLIPFSYYGLCDFCFFVFGFGFDCACVRSAVEALEVSCDDCFGRCDRWTWEIWLTFAFWCDLSLSIRSGNENTRWRLNTAIRSYKTVDWA